MIKILSYVEFKKLESSLGSFTRKEAAILSLPMYCGLRVGEVCQLRSQDLVETNESFVEVHIPASISKTGIGRPVPVPSMASFFLLEYIFFTWPRYIQSSPIGYLFPGTGGRPFMSVHGIEQLVSRICFKVLHKRIMPHVLRHTYATMMLKHANIREVQMLLGHKKLSSTQIYTHPTIQDLSKSVNKTFS